MKRYRSWSSCLLLLVTILAACTQTSQPSPTRQVTIPTAPSAGENTQMPPSISGPADESLALVDYALVEDAIGLPRQSLDPAYPPLDVLGGHYVALGPDGELYLIALADGAKTQITSDGLLKGEAVLSNGFIVWTAQEGTVTAEYEGESSELPLVHIYLYHRTEGQQQRITAEAAPRVSLDLHRDRLVWADKRNEINDHYTHYDIYAYDLRQGVEMEVAVAAGAQINPDVHGGIIVWQDNRNSPALGTPLAGCGNCPDNRFDIYGMNIGRRQTLPLVEDEYFKANPTLFGEMVVWEAHTPAGEGNANGWADLYALEISTGRLTRLTNTHEWERDPILFGQQVLWRVASDCDVVEMDATTGAEIVRPNGIYVYDLTSGATQRLTAYKDPAALFDGTTAVIREGCMTDIEYDAVSPAP